ncbi:hypothetical protein, partial [Streptococcus pseudopneumoniae]|uniref:hypothetical protein n=1 Tax=Streptococcus pseudopneumoniae TaxID=257758 RepID=UPI001BB1AEFE
LNRSITLLKKYIQSKKHSLTKVENNLQNYKDRLSVSETGLGTTNNNYSDLKTKVLSASKMSNQLTSRISQLQRRKERLLTEIVKQESYVHSLDERISLVQQNFADPEQGRIANELSRLNEKKSTLLSQQSEVVTDFKEKESKLATLLASETREKSKSKTLHEEHVILNNEKHELD